MAGKDIIAMSQEELKRLSVIHKTIDRHITQEEAGKYLDLSDRQIRRLIARVLEEGDKGIVHKTRGKPSPNAIADGTKRRVINLCKKTYTGFGPTLASEKLFERDKIKVSRETLRQWLRFEKLSYQYRKKRPHRHWRPRKGHYGEMVQMDGSEHDWFEGRGAVCVLMGYIDDATSRPFARFYEYEGTKPAMDSFIQYAKKHGLPASVYLDRHSTYKPAKGASIEEQLLNQDPLSQFGRALNEMRVDLIHAHSAPAKGRIERLFKTFQDRLIKEMRLRNISSIEEANKFLRVYLPAYSKRFGVPPAKRGDLHRQLPKGIDLDKIFCIKTDRALRKDFTIAHKNKLYQVLNNIRADKVTVEERINDSMVIRHKGKLLRFKEVAEKPQKLQAAGKAKTFRPRTVYIPSAGHPWKRRFKVDPRHVRKIKNGAPKKETELQLTAEA